MNNMIYKFILLFICFSQFVLSQNIPIQVLDYGYDEYEPLFSKDSLELHHQIIENQYVKSLNSLLKKMRKNPETNKITKKGVDYIITHLNEIHDTQVKESISIYGGGYVLHDFFWKCIVPKTEYMELEGELKDDILSQFESIDEFINEFTTISLQYNGSGWIWFVYNLTNQKFEIYYTQNNDHIVNTYSNVKPLFILDLWEHSYLLQYPTEKHQYIHNFFEQINWNYISNLYKNIKYSNKDEHEL